MSKRLSLKRNSALVVGGGSMDGSSVDLGELDKNTKEGGTESSQSLKRPKGDDEDSVVTKTATKSTLSSKSAPKISAKPIAAPTPTPLTKATKTTSSSSLKAAKDIEKDAGKVSITLSSAVDSKTTEDLSTITDNGSSIDAESPETSTPVSANAATSSPLRGSGTWRVPVGVKGGNSKYNTLPLPPKNKYPSSSATTATPSSSSSSSSSSTTGLPTTTRATTAPLHKSASSTSSLGKTSASSITLKTPTASTSSKPPGTKITSSSKPPTNRPLTTLELQEQTRKLLLQVQQQKQQLELQQEQLEHSQLTQQQLQQKIQLQELEQKLLQEEQVEKQQQLEQHVFTKQQLEQRLQRQQLDQLQHQQLLQQLQFQFSQPQFSPAAQLFISQNVFQPHHSERKANPSSADFLHTGTYLAEFTHTPAQAIAAYNDWKESQWLLPQAFASQLDPLMFIPMHLPFYSFSLITHSVHSGRIGHFVKPAAGAEVSSSEFAAIRYEFAKERAESFVHTQLHPDVLVYAPTFELVSTPDFDLMQEIWYWKLGDLKPHVPANKRYSMPILSRATSVTALDVKTVHSTTVQEAWPHAFKKLLRNEQYCVSATLKRELMCDVVEDVRTDTTFSHIAVKLVYLPVYVWTHNYQGTTYQTVMNAQNGLVYGRRPYALKSSLDSCFQLLAGGEQLMSKNEIIQGVISGADLAQRDNFPVHASPYRVDLPYVVFPPSDQFLVMVATGWLRVQNVSEHDTVELVAQKRTSSHVGRSLILVPGAEKVIAYRGAWCFCVTTGDPQSVLIAYVCTHSGTDKEDSMGMV